MAASATLSPAALAVPPGGEGSVEVRVHNAGSAVDQYRFEVVGDGVGWMRVDPPVLSLFPGSEGVVRLTVRPPQAAAVGTVPYAVRVSSRSEGAVLAVPQGTVHVGVSPAKGAVGPAASPSPAALPSSVPAQAAVPAVAPPPRTAVPPPPAPQPADPATSRAGAADAAEAETKVGSAPSPAPQPPRKSQEQTAARDDRRPGGQGPAPAEARPAEEKASPARGNGGRGRSVTPGGSDAELTAAISPRSGRSATMAGFEVTVTNRGSTPVNARLRAVDRSKALNFVLDASTLRVQPRASATATLQVRPQEGRLVGTERTHPFQVSIDTEAGEHVVATAAFVQAARIPRSWAAAVLAVLALLALWIAVIRPTIDRAAEDAVRRTAGGSAGGATGAVAGGTPVDGRLTIGGGGSASYTTPAGRVLRLTDIVLQNPRGEVGELQVQRNAEPLLVVALENFRDLDYHFVTPVVFAAGDELTITATCTSTDCTPAAYFTGTLVAA